MAKNNKPKGKLIWKILCGVFAFLFAFLMIGGPIANNYTAIINMVLGEETGILTYQEDELGEITFRSILTIR